MLFESANHITLFINDNTTLGIDAILVAKFQNTNSRGEKKMYLRSQISLIYHCRWSHIPGGRTEEVYY